MSDSDRALTMTATAAPARPRLETGADGAAVSLCGVSAGYGRRGRPILRDVDLTVPERGCWAILGPSGSGKTTLLRVILGLLEPRAGAVRRPVLDQANGAAHRSIGYIPQNLGIVRNLSVRENVLLGSLGRLSWWRSLWGRFPSDEIEAAEDALARVGLAGRGGERVECLSGGERRRVAIARALLQRPRLLLADEFLAEVDRATAEEIVGLLRELRRDMGLTIIFVDHDIEHACRIADRVVVLVEGRVVGERQPGAIDPDRAKELFRATPD